MKVAITKDQSSVLGQGRFVSSAEVILDEWFHSEHGVKHPQYPSRKERSANQIAWIEVRTMAPNVKTRLLYENDDLERVAVFEKKGS